MLLIPISICVLENHISIILCDAAGMRAHIMSCYTGCVKVAIAITFSNLHVY